MHYFSTNFQKSPSAGAPIILDFGDLKLRNLVKSCFFKLIMTKSNLKKISYDAIIIPSPKNVTKQRHKIFPFWGPNQNFWLRQCNIECRILSNISKFNVLPLFTNLKLKVLVKTKNISCQTSKTMQNSDGFEKGSSL